MSIDASASPALQAFLEDAARAQCEALVRCAPNELWVTQNIGSVEHCVDLFMGSLRNRERDLVAAVGTTITFDPSGAEACVTAVGEAACAQGSVRLGGAFDEWPAACRAVLAGTVETGAACALDEECVSGECACQVCVEPAPTGLACSDEQPCDHALACVEGECVARAGVGEACRRDIVDDPIGTCGQNLLCVAGTCHTQSEYRTRTVGMTCNTVTDVDEPRDYCAANLVCRNDVFGEPGTCRELLPSGADCDSGGHGICGAGTFCHGPAGSATCQPRAQEGESCFSSGSGDPCDVGLVCLVGESRCGRVQANGETCHAGSECYSGECTGEPDATICAPASDEFCL